MQFDVTAVSRGAEQLLHVTGELDIATVPLLRSAVDKALAEQPARLLLDLTPTRFIDSTGCREVILSGKAGRAQGVAVEVVAPPDNWKVRRVLDFVQLDALLPVHDELPTPRAP